ncbi:MAG: response regulator [Rhodoferax sp.]|uniref:ATP-binding response regulator n=1 Tax=Rhodoferax sp. TaxID=50421 RepID=UPI00140125FC|nr:hybrid sensor histidine kinase/response regulator [Rhodoferax sp.]NDP38622.1 response regulator [Rhodoferax sp.]
MKNYPLRLADGRVLVQQLHLMLSNVRTTVLPVFVVSLCIVWTLSTESNAMYLRLWAGAIILSNLNWFRYAQRQLASGLTQAQAPQVVRTLTVINLVGGSLWGSLVWITFDTVTLAGGVLVFALMAGMAAGAVSTQGPILRLYLAFLLSQMVVVVSKLWFMSDPAQWSLGGVIILYALVMLGQAANLARLVRSAIDLRFENQELLEKLRQESALSKAAQREAEQANAAKSKFLAAASHDLRQPIHAQGLFLEVLSRSELSPQQRELLASASAASEASAEMLNTLLDFSRIEAGVVEPQVRAFGVQTLLNKIEREFVQQADAKGLDYRSRESALVLRSDPALIEMILRNLISNAIRYTVHGGLLVTCRQRAGEAVLEVWDTGIGIEPAQQREVFREFHQLGNPERDRRKGLGLGLAIVDGLARTLGHPLSLNSKMQQGSVFRLVVPITTATVPLEPALPEQSNHARLNVRVLLIDDEESVRAGMMHLLQDWGCVCEVAASIEEALALARIHAPEVVISDYRLREQRTGVEAIQALRALLGDALPALLITGDTAPDRLREALASGITLLHKPVPPSHLYRGLVTALPPQMMSSDALMPC